MARKTHLYQVNVTRACNLRCTHCYIHSDVKAASGRMAADDFVRVMRGIAEHMGRIGYEHAEIHVIGGEPTMMGLAYYQEVIPQARAALDGLGFSYELILVSNLLSPEVLAIARLFNRVNTSWEPVTRFPKPKLEAMWRAAVHELRAAGLDVGVTTAVTRPVVAMGARAILDHLYHAQGIRQIHFGFFIPSGDGKDNQEAVFPAFHETSAFLIDAAAWYLEHRDADPALFVNPPESMVAAIHSGEPLDDIVCPIIAGSMDIDWDGNSATCLEAGGSRDAKWLGNVLRQSVSAVAASPEFRREVIRAARPHPGCMACEEYAVCRSGCGVLARAWDPQTDADCPGFKRFIKHMRALHAGGLRPKYDDYRGKTAC